LPRRAPLVGLVVNRSTHSETFLSGQRPRKWGLARPFARAFATEEQAKKTGGGQAAGEARSASEKEDTGAEGEAKLRQQGEAGPGDEEPQQQPKAKGSDTASATSSEEAAAEPVAAEEQKSPEELLQKQLEDLQEKVKAEKHNLLLALADFENNKKRYLRERESRRRTATVNFATRLIETYDKFDDLVHAEDNMENLSEACQGLQEGITLTHNLYRSTFERFDVQAIEADSGKPLVKDMHESVGAVQGSDLPADSVAELVRTGWVLEPGSAKPAVLRKAQVKVAASA